MIPSSYFTSPQSNREWNRMTVPLPSSYLAPPKGNSTMTEIVCQRVAILYDNRVGYISMSGKPFSNSTRDLIFRQPLDLDEIRWFYTLQNFKFVSEKKLRLIENAKKWPKDFLFPFLQALVPPILNQLRLRWKFLCVF